MPNDIPKSPNYVYKNKGWIGWTDWLGHEKIRKWRIKRKTLLEARNYARTLKLKKLIEWLNLSKSGQLPKDIPSKPNVRYKNDGWKGWADFLGKE